MNIDHIFIFTNDKGLAADQLVEFGFTEGSSRVHTGQGTANRKFYFENFFLEILWVHNEEEIKSKQLQPTQLWQRANYQRSEASPFGLCIINTDESDLLFESALAYQPSYFPQGLTIDVLHHENDPSLPWTFRLPYQGAQKNSTEPIVHKNGIKELTKAVFYCRDLSNSSFTSAFSDESQICFKQSDKIWTRLIFDKNEQGRHKEFEDLKLTIEY